MAARRCNAIDGVQKSQPWHGVVFFLASLVFILSVSNASADVFNSGAISLKIEPAAVVSFGTHATVADPLSVDVIDQVGHISHGTARYTAVQNNFATGTVTTPGGSTVQFTDHWAAQGDTGTFALTRDVRVITAGKSETGYRTELAVQSNDVTDTTQMFVPGMWYCDTAHVPPSGMIAALPGQRDFLFREDRMALPLAMLRASNGWCLSIIHDHPDGGTFKEEYVRQTIIDDRLQFASLGFRKDAKQSVVLAFPGVEGDQTRLGRYRAVARRAERFHPLKTGAVQHYQLLIHLSHQSNFDDAMRDSWRTAYTVAAPVIADLPMDRVYQNSIDLLDHYEADYHGVPGFPFTVKIPGGEIEHISMQMGFVGEQIPCASYLIGYGAANHRADLMKKGENIVDFWAGNTLSPQHVPRTWYDVEPDPQWRKYNTFTRVATDGMEGMLQAWRRMKLARQEKPAWLACCREYGDWLVTHQNPDGSFCREYDFAGKIVDPSKSAALHPVRFLVDLSLATGDSRYAAAANHAGDFAIHDIGSSANYYGGTADNADVKDKEAGWIALDSFLSLYETTDQKKWLIAAARAADFTETWVYSWNVPIPRDDPRASLPPMLTTAGASLIATGHSGADVYMAFGPFAYYRLAIYTGDHHYADMAKLLMYDTRQWVDVDGSHHYAVPGLMTEATNIAAPRGWGVGVWLPWCTAAVVEPMTQFQDAFGTMDLNAIDQLPIEDRLKRLRAFSARHGFPGAR